MLKHLNLQHVFESYSCQITRVTEQMFIEVLILHHYSLYASLSPMSFSSSGTDMHTCRHSQGLE